MLCSRRKRLQVSRVLFLLSGVCLCALYQLTVSARLQAGVTLPQTGLDFGQGSAEGPEENLTEDGVSHEPGQTPSTAETETSTETFTSTQTPPPPAASPRPSNKTLIHCVYLTPPPPPVTPTPLPAPPEAPSSPSPPGGAPHAQGDYPEDLFSIEERRRGWVLLHILGMMYMFVSLAIVCDEFFVPALGVITDKLAISDDVAGATFMAAGGSAPELFTSLIGVFIAHSNVGIGTIVGSAVFNILFVIGMCALFSREMLHLTWWPLFRDVSFYILDLILLILFFLDNVILWWESLMLVGGYSLYVVFMKYNVQIERFVKGLLHRHKMIVKVIALEEPEKVNGDAVEPGPTILEDKNRLKLKPSLQRGGSSASLHNSTMRNTIFQLMIHTLDPLGDGKFKDKAETLNSVASKKTEGKTQDKRDDVGPKPEQSKDPDPPKAPDSEKKETEDTKDDVPADGGSEDSDDSSDSDESDDSDESEESEEEEEEGEEEEPLSLEWPDTRRKQVTYLLLLPIVLPLWLTVPDVRNQKSRKFFVMTFLGSIIWIAIFSYLMVWWAHQVGETIGISEEIMGLTILAAGTSIPDLITSVIVARKGLGDMAVSSSVGSNIFDITVGLPVPWLLYSSSHGFAPVAVSSNGLFCAIVLLFLMLLFVIVSIACCKWKMNKFLGFTMFLLYFIFLVLSVMLEDRLIICPVSI
ncbi:sodium/potassium/calcium exchanger 1-like [Boleophthalmus pectinirostris]|uniref:sodium/potassium/calcium exchanger 1-like n=1 Tax=Boleophthalmus pectinirostris TaxID=150288 RepID=UPI00242AEDFB|nr:sodium/potassium/calcium exchanger 1-like [Boleophthalmus pectinirostris]